MQTQKYSVNQHPIETILSWVKSGEIAIPEIQRPFVWKAAKVRDLMDSLYKGFPIGYLISWRNPNVRLKDGSLSEGKKILIDGQQRVTALKAAILHEYIIDKNYNQTKITIAFNPIEERFEVSNPAIKKYKTWIANISEVFDGSTDQFDLVLNYIDANPGVDSKQVKNAISGLVKMPLRQIGLIELAADLDIEVVTEIFIRINSQGVELSQADFVMSKIAANETYGGQDLRKAIDYFCHLAVAPHFYPTIRDNDVKFITTDYFKRMEWLKNENDDLYDPKYTDLIRVAFALEFKRGKLSDLVSLLSGRNFETRTYEEDIAQVSFASLQAGVMKFMSETEFKRFVMIIKSAGFVQPWMIRSQNALNFAYLLYLTLRSEQMPTAEIESYVKKWFVLTILTGRATGSFESQLDFDIKQFAEKGIVAYFKDVEAAELGEAFWESALPLDMNTSSTNSPYWHLFLAAQVRGGDKGFLSKDIGVAEMVQHRGDIHHIFPKDYLKKQGLTRGKYNQIANYVYMQSEINIKVGNKAPNIYLNDVKTQIESGDKLISGITSMADLNQNFTDSAIPSDIINLDVASYEDFLQRRRQLMAAKIREYYYSL